MKQKELPEGWKRPLERWTFALRAAGRTDQTIETRTEAIRRFARHIGAGNPALVSRARLIEWAGSHQWAPETRRSEYASLRGFYSFLYESGAISDDISAALPHVAAGIPRPRPADDATYRRALENADNRTHVILRLAGEAGMRRAEIAAVNSGDLFRDLCGDTIRVHGKGRRDRFVPLTDSLAFEVRAVIQAGGSQWLLPSPAGGHLTARHVGRLAGRVLTAPYTLHTLRHRFATTVHEKTHDLRAVQELLGHASVATTQRYVAISADALREAARSAAI